MSLRLRSDSSNYNKLVNAVLASRARAAEAVSALVLKIASVIKTHGDKALLAYNRKFEGVNNRRIRLCVGSLINTLDLRALFSLKFAYDRVATYHAHQLPLNVFYRDGAGVRLGSKWTPLNSVSVCVPEGAASYFSSIIMNAVPARIAGVKQISLITPYYRLTNRALINACAKLCGIKYIYCSGGAQTVIAAAVGTRAITKVDKITGPGSVYAAASRKLFGPIGADCVAAPSATMLITDYSTNAWTASADLTSQLEHDKTALALLVAKAPALASSIRFKTALLTSSVARHKIARYNWSAYGITAVCRTSSALYKIVRACTPERLQIQTAWPMLMLSKLRAAGAVFLGKHTPVAVGDYVGGANHTLVANPAARFSSGLSVLDYVKRASVIWVPTKRSLGALASVWARAALSEGLSARALAIACRLAN
ncbi:MAG: Histidinol dehydrogenase [Candidatus Hodgkinia cicadicola]|nr:MAG: Histidinol dehydrogenase [Candidatus Hodgkinia cicadicola]